MSAVLHCTEPFESLSLGWSYESHSHEKDKDHSAFHIIDIC